MSAPARVVDSRGLSAVLVIDLQNAFCSEGGSQAPGPAALRRYRTVIEQAVQMCDRARERGALVVFTQHSYQAGYPELPAALPVARSVKASRGLVRGTWDASVVNALIPGAQDIVRDKSNFDAFLGTDLEEMLRARGVRELIVAGVSTNVCVEATVRTGAQLGFSVVVASDVTAATSDALHKASLHSMAYAFASVALWRNVPVLSPCSD